MRRLGLTLTLLLCCAVTVGFASPSPSRVIYVVNDSSVSQADLEDALPAFQAQIDQDLGPAWNVSAQLVIGQPGPSDWRITVTDDLVCAPSCGGYHEWYQGRAQAFVGSGDWQIVFSHELVEMLVDPYIHGDGDGGRFALAGKRLWLVEVGDPVEDTSFAYQRDGVLLSDFTLPNWYRPHSKGPWDFRGFVRRPGQILSGGYGWYMTAGRWVQV